MSPFATLITLISLLAGGLFSAVNVEAATQLPVQSGDLIRGVTFPAVYYVGADGFRYVFPNEKTFTTWYANFSNVRVISDADLSKIQIGGNVTYKPGVKMVKIESDPRTYAVEQGGILRHITSETIATVLYGATWNTKIDDVPDSFFTNYTIGNPIESSDDYSPSRATSAVANIGEDKALVDHEILSFTSEGIQNENGEPRIVIEAGGTVAFVNTDSTKHAAVADDNSWGTGTLEAGTFFVKRFAERGEYGFHDSYVTTDHATVIVE